MSTYKLSFSVITDQDPAVLLARLKEVAVDFPDTVRNPHDNEAMIVLVPRSSCVELTDPKVTNVPHAGEPH